MVLNTSPSSEARFANVTGWDRDLAAALEIAHSPFARHFSNCPKQERFSSAEKPLAVRKALASGI